MIRDQNVEFNFVTMNINQHWRIEGNLVTNENLNGFQENIHIDSKK